MSAETNKMTDKEIAQWQEELYELKLDCSTRPSITEEEQMRRIDKLLSGNFRRNFRAKVAARREKLKRT